MLFSINHARKIQDSIHNAPVEARKFSSSPLRMAQNILSIASECSNIAHQAIRISLTGETDIKPGDDSFVDEMLIGMSNEAINDYLTTIDAQIHKMRNEMIDDFHAKQNAGASRDFALAQAFGGHIIKAMLTNTGNCAEKAMLAGILIKATIVAALKDKGFTDLEIENAKIEVSIAENGRHGGDHTVCLLSYNINEKKEFIVDPWLHGTVYDQEDAYPIYEAALWDQNEPTLFDKIDDNKTQVINDQKCINIVLQWAKEFLGNEQPFQDLLKFT